jgi:hypothetical protein
MHLRNESAGILKILSIKMRIMETLNYSYMDTHAAAAGPEHPVREAAEIPPCPGMGHRRAEAAAAHDQHAGGRREYVRKRE